MCLCFWSVDVPVAVLRHVPMLVYACGNAYACAYVCARAYACAHARSRAYA